MMTMKELQNAGTKLGRCVGWVDPISGYHADDILAYILDGMHDMETVLDVEAAAKAVLRREGFVELV